MAWLGEAREGEARQAWRGTDRYGWAWFGRQGKAWRGKDWQGLARSGRQGITGLGTARTGKAGITGVPDEPEQSSGTLTGISK